MKYAIFFLLLSISCACQNLSDKPYSAVGRGTMELIFNGDTLRSLEVENDLSLRGSWAGYATVNKQKTKVSMSINTWLTDKKGQYYLCTILVGRTPIIEVGNYTTKDKFTVSSTGKGAKRIGLIFTITRYKKFTDYLNNQSRAENEFDSYDFKKQKSIVDGELSIRQLDEKHLEGMLETSVLGYDPSFEGRIHNKNQLKLSGRFNARILE